MKVLCNRIYRRCCKYRRFHSHWVIQTQCAIGCGLSYALNDSILWAILHYFLGMAYVVYKAVGYCLLNGYL